MANNRYVGMTVRPQTVVGRARVVLVVGTGGTGARVAMPLAKMLTSSDRLVLMDPDVVEFKNLKRQHFFVEDVGRHKATVVAERVREEGGPQVYAMLQPFTTYPAFLQQLGMTSCALIVIGCVDNLDARAAMLRGLGSGTIYLDVGNLTREGQAIIAAGSWVCREATLIDASGKKFVALPAMSPDEAQYVLFSAWRRFPSLFVKEEEATRTEQAPGCAEQHALDIQTVMVNQMAATAMVNLAAHFIYGIPLSNLGAQFNTRNAMEPILPTRYTTAGYGTRAMLEAA